MSLASAAVHAHPPFPLPAIPRVRPPPIPKGTPGPNTIPIPTGRTPKQKIWADGKWSERASNSAKHRSEVVSRQLEKALKHDVHGMNIYAYKNFKTQQVVYSLTKNMDNNKVLQQLLFHGKQTVPRALRRDMWRPYFSIHFPQTPAGAAKGLQVFKELRELSLRRQLKPPLEMVIATQEDVDNIKRKYTPSALKDATERDVTKRGEKYKKVDMPIVGMRLPKKMVARRLMNQRATSVADVAAVLRRHIMPRPANRDEKVEGIASLPPITPKERLDTNEALREERKQGLSSRAFDRLEKIEQARAKKAEELESRKAFIKPRRGHAFVEKHIKNRLNMEYEGLLYVPRRGMVLNIVDKAQDATREEAGAEMALRAAQEGVAEEKEAQRDIIEREVSAQIDQRLSAMDEAQRSQIQREIEEERTRREETLEAKVAEAESKLRTDLEELYNNLGGLKRKSALAAYRKFRRRATAEITAMKIDESRILKWLGPYAEINDRISGAYAAIDARSAPELASLQGLVDAEKAKATSDQGHQVEIRWADMRDGTHARDWPNSVFHGLLQPKAVVKTTRSLVREYAHLDAQEHDIEQQYNRVQISLGTSVHVFGAEDVEDPSDARWQSPAYLAEQAIEARKDRAAKWTNTETIHMRRRINLLRDGNTDMKRRLDRMILDELTLGESRMLLWLVNEINELKGQAAELTPHNVDPDKLTSIEDRVDYMMKEAHLSQARDEVASSQWPKVDSARLAWVKHSAALIKLECAYPAAKYQADLRDQYLAMVDERMQLLVAVATGKSGAQNRLEDFDKDYPIMKRLMQNSEVDFETRREKLDDIKQTLALQRAELKSGKKAEQAARTALFDVEANFPSIDGKDPEPVVQTKKALDAALARVAAAQQKVDKTTARSMAAIQEFEAKGNVFRNDKDAWLEFKERGGEPGYQRRKRVVSEKEEVEDSDVVLPEQHGHRGLWGRVKGIFGRS